jgi:hypothetical protein
MMGNQKISRILLLIGVFVAGLFVVGFVFRGTALAQSTSAGEAQLLINQVNAVIPREQALGRDTTRLQAAMADLQEIVSNTQSTELDSLEGNGTRKAPIIIDYSDRNPGQSYQRKLDLSYRQLRQIFNNFVAAYPNDFATSSTTTGLPATGASSPTSTVTTTASTSPSVFSANLLISRAQAQISFGNARGIDTTQLQAAVADLQQIVNNTNSRQLELIEGNGTRKSPIVTDYSARNPSQSYQRKLQLSYHQLKQIYDTFVAANG